MDRLLITVVFVLVTTPASRSVHQNAKPHINLVVLGNVDRVNSQIMGRLIYKFGGTDQKILEKFEKEASKGNISKYEWILYKLKTERERGIQLDMPLWTFETQKNTLTIVDAPGYSSFMKNMIGGVSQGDCAIFLVSASVGEFENSMSANGPIKSHIQLAFTLGIKQLIVAVNKMDIAEPSYSEVRFQQIKNDLTAYLNKVGYNPKSVAFIPVTGSKGDNMFEPSGNMPWFSGWRVERKEGNAQGKTLYQALDNLLLPKKLSDMPLRLTVQDVHKVRGIGTMVAGRVETGVLKMGMAVTFAPVPVTANVQYIEMHHETLNQGNPGDNIGFSPENVFIRDINRGYVVGDAKNDPPKETKSFIAQLTILDYPGEIHAGFLPLVNSHNANVPCKFEELIAKIDSRTGKKLEDNPKSVKSGDSVIVKMVPIRPMCVESYNEYPPLGRFSIRSRRSTIAVGIVTSTST